MPELVEPLGHGDVVRGLVESARASQLPHALLFEGPEGIGKFRSAIWLAAALLCDGEVVGPEHLPAHLGGAAEPLDVSAVAELAERAVRDGEPLELARRRVEDRFERCYLEALLVECSGRVGEVARRAGITPRALYDKLRRLDLDRRSFRR